jgi:lysophospholipase L1-like esterase
MRAFLFFLAIVLLGAAFFYGVVVGRYHYFPYSMIQTVFWPDKGATNPRYEIFRASQIEADVVMVGDSITSEGLWAEAIPELKVANRGVIGDTVSDVLGRLDTVASTKAKLAFVMMGINDINRGRNPDDILRDYEAVLRGLRAAGMQTVVFATFECSEAECGASLQEVRHLNEGLYRIATRLKVPFLDINITLSGPDGLKAAHTHDVLHLNAAGYRMWTTAVRNFLRKDGKL